MMEAQALSEKTKKETEILSIEECDRKIDEHVKLLTARKKLIDEEICTEANIDEHLPLN